jgi:hypothetical protein
MGDCQCFTVTNVAGNTALATQCNDTSYLRGQSTAKAPAHFPQYPGPSLRSNYATKHEIQHRANAHSPMQKSHERAVHAGVEVRDKHQENLRLIG